MGAQIIVFLPRYLQVTAEASARPSPISAQGDLAMDHVDTSPSEMPPFEHVQRVDLSKIYDGSSDA